MKLNGKIATVIAFAAILTGCASVVSGDAQTVSIDTGDIGEIAPGTREWLSWLKAKEHCALYSRTPKILDLKGSIAIYKCVPEQ